MPTSAAGATAGGATRRTLDFSPINGWRGPGAIAIALAHFGVATGFLPLRILEPVAPLVDLFFVLSGLVIAHAYGAALAQPAAIPGYVVRRFGRIWPVQAATLAVLVAYETAKLLVARTTGHQFSSAPFDPAKGWLGPYLGSDGRVKLCPVFATLDPSPESFEFGAGGYGYNSTYLGGPAARGAGAGSGAAPGRTGRDGARARVGCGAMGTDRPTLLVLFGGRSGEHAVSCVSAGAVDAINSETAPANQSRFWALRGPPHEFWMARLSAGQAASVSQMDRSRAVSLEEDEVEGGRPEAIFGGKGSRLGM